MQKRADVENIHTNNTNYWKQDFQDFLFFIHQILLIHRLNISSIIVTLKWGSVLDRQVLDCSCRCRQLYCLPARKSMRSAPLTVMVIQPCKIWVTKIDKAEFCLCDIGVFWGCRGQNFNVLMQSGGDIAEKKHFFKSFSFLTETIIA